MWVGGHTDAGLMAFPRLLMNLATHTHLPGTRDQVAVKDKEMRVELSHYRSKPDVSGSFTLPRFQSFRSHCGETRWTGGFQM